MSFSFEDTVTGLTTNCSRNITGDTTVLETLIEPAQVINLRKYHLCDDENVGFLCGQVGGLAIIEFVTCGT